MPFDIEDELDRVVVKARFTGMDEDEIISAFELKTMALREEQANAAAEQAGTKD